LGTQLAHARAALAAATEAELPCACGNGGRGRSSPRTRARLAAVAAASSPAFALAVVAAVVGSKAPLRRRGPRGTCSSASRPRSARSRCASTCSHSCFPCSASASARGRWVLVVVLGGAFKVFDGMPRRYRGG
jgi:hypothetical protein